MPPNCVKVDRTTKWGNPFAVGELIESGSTLASYVTIPGGWRGMRSVKMSAEQTIVCYSWWLIEQPHLMLNLHELRGKDLACWCKIGSPCHADELIRLVMECA